MANLCLSNVSKHYQHHCILDAINLEVSAGEMVVIVGPSGCGKTTLLRVIAGLEDFSEGEIRINQELVNYKNPKDRNIAMVFQNYALYPHMSVFNNLAYGLRMRGYKKELIEARVARIAQNLGLGEVLHRKPQDLSGGQRQRVAMGRAMVREPAIFLFDEPLSNLDTKLRVQMRFEIKQLQRQFRTTSLYVTHDQVEAMTLADRLVVMNHGKIQQMGTPLEIYHSPANKFVASFMGCPAMNFFEAKFATGNYIELLGGHRLVYEADLKSPVGDKAWVGIRPENFILASSDAGNTLCMTIRQIELLGADSQIYGVIAGTEQELIVRLPAEENVKVEDKLHLHIPPKYLHFFDYQSEDSLT